ncbi:MAG: hypothetical protein ACI8UO_000573 [Verrucomicrobiales bacterium]|jgi:hypothetical protein
MKIRKRKILSAIALAFLIAGSGLVRADVAVPPSKKKAKRDAQAAEFEAKIDELEQKNGLLRARNIHLQNKLDEIQGFEHERISDVEKNAREAIQQLLPNLELAPNPENPRLPQLRLRLTEPVEANDEVEEPAAETETAEERALVSPNSAVPE